VAGGAGCWGRDLSGWTHDGVTRPPEPGHRLCCQPRSSWTVRSARCAVVRHPRSAAPGRAWTRSTGSALDDLYRDVRLVHGPLRRAALGSRTPDLRITRVTAKSLHALPAPTTHLTALGALRDLRERRTTCQNSCQRRTHAWQGDRPLSDAFCMRRPNRPRSAPVGRARPYTWHGFRAAPGPRPGTDNRWCDHDCRVGPARGCRRPVRPRRRSRGQAVPAVGVDRPARPIRHGQAAGARAFERTIDASRRVDSRTNP
jgi:hypothetical protein